MKNISRFSVFMVHQLMAKYLEIWMMQNFQFYRILYIANFSILINGFVHEILVFMSYVQKPPVKALADMSNMANGLIFGLSLHRHPYFVRVSSEGSGNTCLSNMYQNLMC